MSWRDLLASAVRYGAAVSNPSKKERPHSHVSHSLIGDNLRDGSDSPLNPGIPRA